MPIRVRPLTLAAVLAVGLVLVGCTNGNQQPGDPSSSKGSPSPTLAPGNESTAKGEPPAAVPVEPVIVFAGLDEGTGAITVSAYIAGVIENGGTCTVTFTGPSSSTSVTSEGLADVNTTSCGNVELESGLVTPGSWSVVVSYSSAVTPAVSSAPTIVEVP